MNDSYEKEVVEDIQRVAKQLGKSELSRSDYLGHGKYSMYHIYAHCYKQLNLLEMQGSPGVHDYPPRIRLIFFGGRCNEYVGLYTDKRLYR